MATIDTTGSDFLLGRNTPGNASSGLSGTLSGMEVNPGGTPPASPPVTPPAPKTTPNTGSDTALANALTAMEGKFQSNNALMSQRNLLLKHLYNQPLTDGEKQQLDPSMLDAINSGDRNRIDMNLRLISDEVSGRNNTLDQSFKFLVDSYSKEQDKIEQQKKDAISNVLNFAQTYGSNAKSALTSLYGQDYVDHLKTLGINLDKFSSTSTLAEQKNNTPSGLNNITTYGGNGIVAGVKVPTAIAGDVEDVLSGKNTLLNIRQTMGRTNAAAAYMQNMRNAIHAIDPNFDFIASDAGGKFVSSTFYQKALSAITSVEPNIDKAVQLSNQVNRSGLAYVNNLLQKGSIQIGNTKVSNFREAQSLIADEIGLALGQGAVSDMKLQLGFDITDPSLSAEQFASNMALVKEFLANRKKALQDQRYSSSVSGGTGTDNSTLTGGKFDSTTARSKYNY